MNNPEHEYLKNMILRAQAFRNKEDGEHVGMFMSHLFYPRLNIYVWRQKFVVLKGVEFSSAKVNIELMTCTLIPHSGSDTC